jgi:4,5-dihydroxyphthalate decarboxylase
MDLTLAIGRYDRHVPFFNGTVQGPRGLTLKPLEVGESARHRDGGERHGRMLQEHAFDIAELSLSSFIMALARNPDLPLIGVPIFPRRLFSMGQIYVGVASGIAKPADLIGRKVGLHSFQTTLSVLAKGDLKLEYGLPWEQVHWVCMRPEIVPVELGGDVKVDTLPPGSDLGAMLCAGEIEALISPYPPRSLLARPDRYRRLFADIRAEEVRYFRKYGFYPIMHLIVMKYELAERFPELPHALLRMFDDAKKLAYEYYDDPNYSLLIDARLLYERQRADFGGDPWPHGFGANRKNLEQFIRYSYDQRLIPEPFPPERLFHPATHRT